MRKLWGLYGVMHGSKVRQMLLTTSLFSFLLTSWLTLPSFHL